MAIDLSTYTRVFSDEFFDGYNAKNGKDVVLTPKNKGKLTFDGTWRELIIPTADHGLLITITGSGSFSYTAEVNESVFDVDGENDGE